MYQINKTQGGFNMETKKKVPTLNKVAYGIGTGGGCIFNQIAAAFLLNYYTDTVLIGAGAIATMFLVCRIFDGITDLVMGGIVDKTSSKLGKARPWLIASAPLTLLGIVLLMNVPSGLGDTGKLAYAYITYIFMNCIVYTIYGISNTAMLPLMTHDRKTSSVILGGVACVLILISGLLNKEMENAEEGRQRASVPMSKQLPATLKNRYFWLLLLLGAFSLIMNSNAIGAQIFYCNMVLQNPMFMSVLMTAGQLPGIFILFLMPAVSKKWNKKTFLLMGAILIIAGFAITGLAGENTTMIVVGTVIRSLGVGPILSAVFALIPDVVEYGNWKFGIRSEGLISSAQSIGSKIGIGVGSALTGWILAAVGYNPVAEPTQAVINAVKFDYTWMGAILGIIILIIVLLLDVEKYADQYNND